MQQGMPLAGVANLRMRAQQGDPQAIQELQFIEQQMGSGGQPGMPPQGVPPGQGQLSPQGGGGPIPSDVQARRAKQLIELLRARGDIGVGRMGQPMRQGY
jgi:hypothetical protein